MVYVRVGSATRAKGQFDESWELTWDTSYTDAATYPLVVTYIRERSPRPQIVFDGKVTVVDKTPFEVSLGSENANGYDLSIKSGEGFSIASPSLYLDGSLSPCTFATPEKGLVPFSSILPPGGDFAVEAEVSYHGVTLGRYRSAPYHATLSSKVRVNAEQSEVLDGTSAFNASLRLGLDVDAGLKPRTLRIRSEGKDLMSAAYSDKADLPLWAVPSDGEVRVMVESEDGSSHYSEPLKPDLILRARQRRDELMASLRSRFVKVATAFGKPSARANQDTLAFPFDLQAEKTELYVYSLRYHPGITSPGILVLKAGASLGVCGSSTAIVLHSDEWTHLAKELSPVKGRMDRFNSLMEQWCKQAAKVSNLSIEYLQIESRERGPNYSSSAQIAAVREFALAFDKAEMVRLQAARLCLQIHMRMAARWSIAR